MLAVQGKGDGGSAELGNASMNVDGGCGAGASRGRAAVLALLGSRQGWAADVSASAACLRPRAEVRGG